MPVRPSFSVTPYKISARPLLSLVFHGDRPERDQDLQLLAFVALPHSPDQPTLRLHSNRNVSASLALLDFHPAATPVYRRCGQDSQLIDHPSAVFSQNFNRSYL